MDHPHIMYMHACMCVKFEYNFLWVEPGSTLGEEATES